MGSFFIKGMDAFYPHCNKAAGGRGERSTLGRTLHGQSMTRSTRARVWKVLTPLAGAVSCAKGLRRPNLWAATQAMVNYDCGWTRRGLFGATLGSWLHLERYGRFTWVSLALLLGLLGMLAWLTVRNRAFQRLGAGEPAAIFFSSYAITYLAHVVGYLEIPLAIVTVGLLLVRRPMLRLALAVPVCLAGLLVHEMFLLVFLPVVLFSLYVDGTDELTTHDRRRRRIIWAGAAGLALLSTGVTVGVSRPLSAAQAAVIRAGIERRAEFPVREDFFPVLERSTAENVRMTADAIRTPFFRHRFVVSALTFAPTLLMLLAAIAGSVRALEPRRRRGLTLAAALVAALSPVGMNLLGYDAGRWDALVCLEAYLVLLCLARSVKVEFGVTYRVAAVVVIGLSLVSGEWFAKDILMDEARANSFGSLLHMGVKARALLQPSR